MNVVEIVSIDGGKPSKYAFFQVLEIDQIMNYQMLKCILQLPIN